MTECSQPTCANPPVAHGLCDDHYDNEYPRGTLAHDMQRLADAYAELRYQALQDFARIVNTLHRKLTP
jgi:hypothetical protein